MSDFTEMIDRVTSDIIMSSHYFGEETPVLYLSGGVSPGIAISSLFDGAYVDDEYSQNHNTDDTKPRLLIKKSEIDNGKIKSSDVFVVRGVQYNISSVNDDFLGMIEIFLNKR